ncbi:ly-6/neurotoxin-like protein 1 isoform X2 [Tursiops truncatus]|uniref:ly-6/neurotoxin-like protein 1 isoform X2 n=1 Tax=Tursiops truncatus TaxID=9739 RepID=UPI003CCF6DA1
MVPLFALFLVALVGLPVGSGLPRVRLQWRELLQPHALPGHGHLLHDHAHLLHPDQDEEGRCGTTPPKASGFDGAAQPPPLSKDGGVGTVCCLWGIFSWPVNTDVKGTPASALCGSKHCKTTLQGRSRYHAPFTDEETEAQRGEVVAQARWDFLSSAPTAPLPHPAVASPISWERKGKLRRWVYKFKRTLACEIIVTA